MTRGRYVIDIGNGDYKIGSNLTGEILSYPAIIGQLGAYDSLDLGSGGSRIDNLSVRRDNKEFAIGNMAVKNSSIRNHDVTEDKYLSQDNLILSHAAFALLTDVTYSLGNVVLGLPLHKMKAAKEITKLYQGYQFGGHLGFYGKYEEKPRSVQIDKAVVVAQPHGTLFNLILDANGEIVNKQLAASGVAVFDIGFKTNDGVVFKNLEPIGRLAIHSKNGMYIAYEEIKQRINNEFNGLEVKLFEIPNIIKTGKIKGQDVSRIINDALYNLASNIILEVKTKWDDAWEIEQIVFTGGGAVLLKPYLEQAFQAIFKDAKSNAEGMLKYANRLWGREAQ